MDWLALSLLTALLSAGEAAGMKKWLAGLTPYEMGIIPLLFAQPLVLAAWLALPGPAPSAQVWLAIAPIVPCNALAFLFYCQAVRLSPLSLTMPYLALSPALVMVLEALFLGRMVNVWGGAGVLLMAAGSYVLNLPERSRFGLLGPITAVFREPGCWRMLLTAAVFSVSTVLSKQAGDQVGPVDFLLCFMPAYAAFLLLAFGAAGQVRLRSLLAYPGRGAALGLINAAHNLSHMLALVLGPAAYMLALKRLDGLFAVAFGRLALREDHIPSRLAGAGLMAAGAALIGIWGR
jgi:drug/metabolite transporter (DMT)-like permease